MARKREIVATAHRSEGHAQVALQAILEAADVVEKLKLKYAIAKDAAKDAKDAYEKAVDHEQAVIRESKEEYPLFAHTIEKSPVEENGSIDHGETDAITAAFDGAEVYPEGLDEP